jgi:hypothetical protein
MNPSVRDCGESPDREIAALRMREDLRYPGARHDLADALGALVAHMVTRLEDATHDDRMPQIIPSSTKPILASATATAVGAVEGTLKGKSLDGALKAAQIEQAYADAREKNASAALKAAEAAKVRAETKKLEREAAISGLRDVLELLRDLSVPVNVSVLPNGTVGIALGEDLSSELPAGSFEQNTAPEAGDAGTTAGSEASPQAV